MNARSAKQLGYDDGKQFLRVQTAYPNLTKEQYINHGRGLVNLSTRVIKTIDLYLEGWMEAWIEPSLPPPTLEDIPAGTPFRFMPALKYERQVPGRRNALRIEGMDYSDMARCNLLGNEFGLRTRKTRPLNIESCWDRFGWCLYQECRSCPVAAKQFPIQGFVPYNEKHLAILEEKHAYNS